ncbi:hypothetical protein NDU88_000799 [Pleurodeles waltl]|uniref:Uncharacterized protein n=1 Tax=Pleurodeles waltl TaxID=8319 RepID=A0AAV7RAU6_PLEWA|nr:hypothetical protein NDU88_000799 [Pleurodeles waltl]
MTSSNVDPKREEKSENRRGRDALSGSCEGGEDSSVGGRGEDGFHPQRQDALLTVRYKSYRIRPFSRTLVFPLYEH